VKFGVQTPEIHAPLLLFLKTNRLGVHVLFPFARWQHCCYALTALCIRTADADFVYSADSVRVDMWRFVHQRSFFAVLTVFRLYLTIVGTLLDNRHKSTIVRLVTIGTLMVNWSFLLFRLPFDDWNTVGTLLVQSW